MPVTASAMLCLRESASTLAVGIPSSCTNDEQMGPERGSPLIVSPAVHQQPAFPPRHSNVQQAGRVGVAVQPSVLLHKHSLTGATRACQGSRTGSTYALILHSTLYSDAVDTRHASALLVVHSHGTKYHHNHSNTAMYH